MKSRPCPDQQEEDLRQYDFKEKGPLCSHVMNKLQEEKPAGPAFSITQPIVTSPAGLAGRGEAMAGSFPSALASTTSWASSKAKGHAPVISFAAHVPSQGRTSQYVDSFPPLLSALATYTSLSMARPALSGRTRLDSSSTHVPFSQSVVSIGGSRGSWLVSSLTTTNTNRVALLLELD